jgi:hypothetical protein
VTPRPTDLTGSEQQTSKVGAALEMAGMMLKIGETDRAREILREIKDSLDRLMMFKPQAKSDKPEEAGNATEAP